MSKVRTGAYKRFLAKRPSGSIPDWAKIRKRILERDRWQCRVCHDDYNLNVHHIDYERANNADGNLVTLCQPCHKGVHEEGYKPHLFEDWPIPWGEPPREDK